MDLSRPATLPTILRRIVLFGTLAVPLAPMAQEAAPLEPSEDAKKAAYSKQPICKKQAVMGTKISKSVCRTRAQADAQRADSQEFLDSIQKSSTVQSTAVQ